VKENGFEDRITILNGLIEEIKLPVDKVDIIISEWMGYFLLYESMFDSVIFARDKWLAPEGSLLPNRASMFIAALDDGKYYQKRLVRFNLMQSFWDNLYGVSMKCIKKWILSEPVVDPIDHKDILTDNCNYL
jgi:protein arginine N-methyltransferase 1